MKTASQFIAWLLLSSSVLATETNQLQSLHISWSIFSPKISSAILDSEWKIRAIISMEQLRYELYQPECYEKENDKMKAKIYTHVPINSDSEESMSDGWFIKLTQDEISNIIFWKECKINSPKLPEWNHFFVTSDGNDFYLWVVDEQTIQSKAFQDALHQCNILNWHKVYTLYPLKIDTSSPLVTKISWYEWNLPTNQDLCDDKNQIDEQ